MKIVIFGLSVTSSWGNGHATTYRALLKALQERGHHIMFFEKNQEWYASNRDLPHPEFCDLRLFEDWNSILPSVRDELEGCDVHGGERVIGSVRRVLELPSCEALEVRCAGGAGSVLVPMVKDAVRAIDAGARRIEVDVDFLADALSPPARGRRDRGGGRGD